MNTHYAIPALLAALAVGACDKPVVTPPVSAVQQPTPTITPAPSPGGSMKESAGTSSYPAPAGAAGTGGSTAAPGDNAPPVNTGSTASDRDKPGSGTTGIPPGPSLAR